MKNKGVNLRFERLAPHLKGNVEQPDLTTYKESAFSYSSSVEWLFDDVHRLSLMYSHNERLPGPMEPYYHGKHLATSSFRFGNKNLKKERSDNFEISIARETGKLDCKLGRYHNNFDNYIHTSYLQSVPQMGRNFVLGLNIRF
ncbi:TonB-dependent receptor domain-containing protein [Bisgaard Taxon 46]